jgi:hypothetical protein
MKPLREASRYSIIHSQRSENLKSNNFNIIHACVILSALGFHNWFDYFSGSKSRIVSFPPRPSHVARSAVMALSCKECVNYEAPHCLIFSKPLLLCLL